MGVYVREAGAWTEQVPFARDGSQWTSDGDSLYARDEAQWKLIYPTATVGSGLLLPVEDLAVDSVDNNSATVSWTNPTQPDVTPTDTQVRLAELGSVWDESPGYPATSWTWEALDPETTYVMQIRLIRRVDGVITDTSAIRHVEFTTDAAPIGPPAPDPGGSGDDTTFPFDGTTGGTPSAPGTNDGCWWEYRVMLLSQTAYTFEDSPLNTLTSDDGVTDIAGTLDGDIESLEISDWGGIDPGRTVRICRREVCDTDTDGTADTFGDWECGDPFPVPADWDAACAGFSGSENVTSVTLTDDAVFRFPKFCKNDDDELVIVEAVSGATVAKGPGFFSFYTDTDGEEGAAPLPDITSFPFYPTMVAAVEAMPTTLVQDADWTLMSRFRANDAFSGSDGRVVTIAQYPGSISIKLTESATGWTPSASILVESGFVELEGDEIPFDTGVTHGVAISWDADGDHILIVDGSEVDTDSTVTQIYEDVTEVGVITAGVYGLINMQQLGWDSALTGDDLAPYFGVSYGTPGELVHADLQNAYNMVVKGDYAYIQNNTSEIVVVDISDPASPTYDNTFTDAALAGTPKSQGMLVDGDYLYLLYGSGNNSLVIVDISDPTAPTLAGSHTPNTTNAINNSNGFLAKSGNYVYFQVSNDTNTAGSSSSLMVVDVSNPASLSDGAVLGYGSFGTGAHIYNDTIYIAGTAPDAIHCIDISSPASPSDLGQILSFPAIGNPAQPVDGRGADMYHVEDTTSGSNAGPINRYALVGGTSATEAASSSVPSAAGWKLAATTKGVFVTEGIGIRWRSRAALASGEIIEPYTAGLTDIAVNDDDTVLCGVIGGVFGRFYSISVSGV